MLTRALLWSCLLLAACGGGSITLPSAAVGPIGPFPAGVTGRIAFVTTDVVLVSSTSHVETKVHVIDVARRADRIIFTIRDVYVEGLAWAPDGEHLVMQTYRSKPFGPNGENRNISQLNRLSLAGEDRVMFDGLGPEYHPAYSSTDGRLAYFAGWSTDATSGIFIDGSPVQALRFWNNNSYLAWAPDGSSLLYTEQASGLWRLNLATGSVAQLVVPENGDVIVYPTVSPDGTRIALMRYAGSRQHQEIWTVSATGSDAKQMTSGCSDNLPAWVPGGAYVAFARTCSGAATGIYIVPHAGGTLIRVVAISNSISGLVWSR